jgi:hypothetical protein
VTLCLASFVGGDKKMVGICDMMISGTEWSGDDMAIKARPTPHGWCVMTAGDPSPAIPVLEYVDATLKATPDNTLQSTVVCFEQAFEEQLQSRRKHILAPYGMTLQNYHQIGPPLGETFQRILFEMSNVSLATTFLVFGFDEFEDPHIFTIRDKGQVEYFDLAGFWAIGSGQTASLGVLFNKNHSRFDPFETVLWNLCEAKFAAEAAPGVGKGSLIVVVEPDGRHRTLFDIEPARRPYQRMKQRPLTKSQQKAVDILAEVVPLYPERVYGTRFLCPALRCGMPPLHPERIYEEPLASCHESLTLLESTLAKVYQNK